MNEVYDNFQSLLLKAEAHETVKDIKFEKWFSLEAFGKYQNGFIFGGRNYGEPIFVGDEFNFAFKSQSIYSPTTNNEKSRSIIYQVHRTSIKIKALECYGEWVNEVPSGYSFQTVLGGDDIKLLDLPFNSTGKNWRLGKDWIFLEDSILVAKNDKEINDYDIILYL